MKPGGQSWGAICLPAFVILNFYQKLMKNDLKNIIGQEIVIDTDSSWTYLGRLDDITDNCAVLSNVDVHDAQDTSTTREVYVMESRRTGIKANRNRVYVCLDRIVSFSSLNSIKIFESF